MSTRSGAPRVDIHFTGEQVSIADIVRLSQLAEQVGLGGVWHAEAFRDSLIPLAAVACATSRIRIGTDVAQWTRTLPNLELAAADLQELSGGRFTLGLGTTARAWNEDWHGISYERPLRRMREYIQGIRLLWTAGALQPVSFEGEVFQVRNYLRFNGPLADPPPIHIGCSLPGMARLAGEIADGVNFNAVNSPEFLRETLLPAVAEGAAKAGRSLDELELGVLVITAVDDDADRARQLARHQIAFYAAVTTYFEPLMARHGFLAEYHAVREAFFAGDIPGAVAHVTDAMVAAIALAGTPADVRAQLRRYDGLVDFVMIYSPSFALPPAAILANHEAMIRAFAA